MTKFEALREGFMSKMASFRVPESTARYLFEKVAVGSLAELLQKPEVAMALMGGGLGAGVGALSGDEEHRWRNGLIGAGVGGTGGYLLGRNMTVPESPQAAPAAAPVAPNKPDDVIFEDSGLKPEDMSPEPKTVEEAQVQLEEQLKRTQQAIDSQEKFKGQVIPRAKDTIVPGK